MVIEKIKLLHIIVFQWKQVPGSVQISYANRYLIYAILLPSRKGDVWNASYNYKFKWSVIGRLILALSLLGTVLQEEPNFLRNSSRSAKQQFNNALRMKKVTMVHHPFNPKNHDTPLHCKLGVMRGCTIAALSS